MTPKIDGMKKKLGAQLILIRIVIPLSLLAASLLRVNVLSLVYGLLVMACPFLPGPKPDGAVAWWTKRYIQSMMVTCLSVTISQLIFHVVLLAHPPYGHDFVDCDVYEKIARQFGFQRLDLATGWQIARLISPDILITLIVIYAYLECIQEPAVQQTTRSGRNASILLVDAMSRSPISLVVEEAIQKTQEESATEGDKWRAWLLQKRIQVYVNLAKDWGFATILALAGIIHPCIFSLPYFGVFLFLATFWASNRTLEPKWWYKVRKVTAVYSGIHVVLVYLYQFEFFQESLLPGSFLARLLGFTVIVKAQCDNVRDIHFDQTQAWSIFVYPLMLMLLYGVTSVQLRIYYESCDEEIVSEVEERIPKATAVRAGGMFNRPQRSIRYGTVTTSPYDLTEKLMQSEQDLSLNVEYSEDGHLRASISTPPVDISVKDERKPTVTTIAEETDEVASPEMNLIEKRKPIFRASSLHLDKGAIATIIQFATRQSYVVSLFMMMGWSISYHSWSTFILLLVACMVWMVPDTRKFCLKLSPFVAVYAEILLCLQYIYGLNLTQEELPDENPRVLRQLGLEKPRGEPACIPLMTKTLFTIMFWVTMRQHLQEKTLVQRERMGLGVVGGPFNIAFAPTHGVKKTAALKVQQFGEWLRSLIAKYWILINCGLLLFISLRTPVVIYRVIYGFFFAIFVNCFQISFRLWRICLYPFWMTMITYCMAVLTLIYTYQFHGFPEMWRNGTGLSYDV